jgi:hypothetical protein
MKYINAQNNLNLHHANREKFIDGLSFNDDLNHFLFPI